MTKIQSEDGLAAQKPKANNWGQIAFYCGLVSIGLLAVTIIGLIIVKSKWVRMDERAGPLFGLFFNTTLVLAPIAGFTGMLSGILFLLNLNNRTSDFKAKRKAFTGISLGLLCMLSILGNELAESYKAKKEFKLIECHYNLITLHHALVNYGREYGIYPQKDQWCDKLIQYGGMGSNDLFIFLCPNIKTRANRKECYYAINPAAEPNSSPDTVLLFETRAGWNQFGGPELLSFKNHYRNCNVLFNDGNVEFVTPSQIGELKWN